MSLGTSMSRPSILTLIFSTGGGTAGAAGFDSVVAVAGISVVRDCQCVAGFGSFHLVGAAFGFKFIPELADEAQHRPGTRFAEGANRPALDIRSNLQEVIRVLLAALATRHALERLSH